jgi:hypothetical protein
MASSDELVTLLRGADEDERATDRGGIAHTAGKQDESEYAMKGNG